MNFVEYPDREMMMLDVANRIAGELTQALHTQDRVTLVVPGGTTPAPVFDCLSDVDIAWDRVNVMLSDERWVPEDDARSNTALLNKRLFVGKAAAAKHLPLFRAADAPEDMIDALSADIAPHLPISVLVLGMGADMHTASLFPKGDRLADALRSDAPVLMPMRVPGIDEVRVTLTGPVLADAMGKHLIITGAEKREALENARHTNDAMLAPIRTVMAGLNVHWAA